MSEIKLTAKPLSRDAFAPYGDVVEINDASHFSINEGAIERFHDLAQLDVGDDPQAKIICSIARCNTASSLPFRIKVIERHPLGTQLFYPMFNGPILLVVGVQAQEPDPLTFEAFVSNGQQGINFHRNVWHIPLISLNEGEKYIIVDRDGPGNNCDFYHFDDSTKITLQALT